MTPQCRHCRYYSSIWTPAVVQYIGWCSRHEAEALAPCEDYEREAGSDDE